MFRRILNQTFQTSKVHFKNPLKQFEFMVTEPYEIPAHIKKPNYAIQNINPLPNLVRRQSQVFTQIQIESRI